MPDTAQEPPYAWVVVWATFCALALIFGVAYSFAAFFEAFANEFQARRADVSLVYGLMGGVYFAGGAFAGLLADRVGPRVVAAAGMLCIAAGLWASSLAESMQGIYAAYGLGLGVGVALVYTPVMANVPPWFSRRRGLASGIASAGIGAGTLVLPLLATWAITVWQWRDASRSIALAVLLLGLVSAWLLRRAPAATALRGAVAPGASLRQALGSSDFHCLYAVCVLASPAMFVPFAHVSAAARDLGVPAAQAVGLVGLIGVGSLVGRFAIGALADRVGRPQTLALTLASMGLSFGLWLVAGGYTALAGFALWMGLSYGGIVSLLPALSMDLFGARAVAAILGTLYTGAAVGNLFGPWLAGAAFDRLGSYAPVVWACALGCGLAMLVALRLARSMAMRATTVPA